MLANNNGCGQCALVEVWLLFEGGDYSIQGLAAWLLFEGGDYSTAAFDQENTVTRKTSMLSDNTQLSTEGWMNGLAVYT